MLRTRVAVSATFTAEPLREPMRFLQRLLGWEEAVAFAPFAQVFQTLLDPAGVFAGNAGGVNVVLVREADLAGDEAMASFVRAVESSARHHDADLLIGVCPSAGYPQEVHLEALNGLARVTVLSDAEQSRLYPVGDIYDERADALGAVPYTEEYFTALAASLMRAIHRLRAMPFKVIALDCDDTLWSGVCGEDGPGEVVVDAPSEALQRFMAFQRADGRLLAIASKNNEADVADTFRAHPEMPLRWEDFAARRIDWQPKAESLRSLAGELGLGLDSFVFVDDNPKETAEVAAELPEVAVVTLPASPSATADFLEHVWALDPPQTVTEEDRNRAESYAREPERARWERQARSLEEFIEGLQLEVKIAALAEHDLPRAAQLTQRTNQMNFSTRRRSEAELRAFLETGAGYVVRARDRFGDYGLVGLLLLQRGAGELTIDTFLLSCRALGRGVEHRMLRRVGELAREMGFERVVAEFTSTPRNAPAEELFDSIDDWSAGALERLVYRPAVRETRHVRAAAGTETRRAADYQKIAELRMVSALMRAAREAQRQPARVFSGQEQPRTELEKHLCALWGDLLGALAVGVHDNFFDLGGHSLLAVQLVARLHRELGVELPLETVYTGTLTVAELARSIELFQLGGMDESEYAAVLAEIENLSDAEAEALLADETSRETRS